MATAKKRGNRWRCLVFDGFDSAGKRRYKSFTADTKKEAEYLAADFVLNKKRTASGKITFEQARKQYIEDRKNVLSPSTIRGYNQMSTYYEQIDNILITKIDERMVQKWANDFAQNHAPKTVKNAHGFLHSVLKECNPALQLNTRLPQKEQKEYIIPSNAQICLLTDFFAEHDKDMLLAVCLASFGGLRRSEICALNSDCINGNVVHIKSATVYDSEYNLHIKTPKNPSSDRFVDLPPFVVALFHENGCMVNLRPEDITHRFGRTVRKLDLPHFRFHDLRHYSATVAHALGIPDQYIQERHGWKSDAVLKSVYRNTAPDFEKQFTDKINSFFTEMQPNMQPRNEKTPKNRGFQ